MKNKPFYFSIRKAEDCLFSRREGWRGKIICGYSVVIRVFGFDLFPSKIKKQFVKEARKIIVETEPLSKGAVYDMITFGRVVIHHSDDGKITVLI